MQYLNLHIKKILGLAFFLSIGLFAIQAQAQTVIHGEVKDVQQVGIPGVSVALKTSATTAVVTISDIDGKFTINSNSTYPVTIVFNMVGFNTREVVVTRPGQPLVVTLEENIRQLDEVVVTALGISREKKSLGYTTQEHGLFTNCYSR